MCNSLQRYSLSSSPLSNLLSLFRLWMLIICVAGVLAKSSHLAFCAVKHTPTASKPHLKPSIYFFSLYLLFYKKCSFVILFFFNNFYWFLAFFLVLNHNHNNNNNKFEPWSTRIFLEEAWKMLQQIKALVALPQILESIPSTHSCSQPTITPDLRDLISSYRFQGSRYTHGE